MSHTHNALEEPFDFDEDNYLSRYEYEPLVLTAALEDRNLFVLLNSPDADTDSIIAEIEEVSDWVGFGSDYGLDRCTCSTESHDGSCALWTCDPWVKQECEWIADLDSFVFFGTIPVKKTGPSVSTDDVVATSWTTTWAPKCRHYETPVRLPCGTEVWPSSLNNRTPDESCPDYGFYFDSSWTAKRYPAIMIPWPDYGLPALPISTFDEMIGLAYERAVAGFTVEFGCIGGHGRTGTFLACMLVRTAGLSAADAIAWVHENYCKEAVEGMDQEWFVARYAAFLAGTPAPPKPHKEVFAKGGFVAGATTSKDSLIGKCHSCGTMNDLNENHTEGFCCSKFGCKFYEVDLDSKEGKGVQSSYPDRKILASSIAVIPTTQKEGGHAIVHSQSGIFPAQ